MGKKAVEARLNELEERVEELERLIAKKEVKSSLAETLRTIADELEEDDELVPAKKSDPNEEDE